MVTSPFGRRQRAAVGDRRHFEKNHMARYIIPGATAADAGALAPVAPPSSAAAQLTTTSAAPDSAIQCGLLAGLDWLDSLSLNRLDGQNLNENGLRSGTYVLTVSSAAMVEFDNITLSLRRPSGGAVALSAVRKEHACASLAVDRLPMV